MSRANNLLNVQVLDKAALKVLKAAEATKQLLQQKEEVLAEIRGDFEQKNKEVSFANHLLSSANSSTQSVYMPLSQQKLNGSIAMVNCSYQPCDQLSLRIPIDYNCVSACSMHPQVIHTSCISICKILPGEQYYVC